MITYRVSTGFVRLSDSPLDTFAQNVTDKLTGNPGFTAPLVSIAALTTAEVAFATAMVAAQGGGKQATATKNMAREALLLLLRQEAAYVQSIAGEDLPLLLSSGFEPASTNRTRIQLPKPVIDRIDNPLSTRLGVRVKPVPTAAAYEVRIRYETTGWEAVGVFTQARSIVIEGRTPGTVYDVQARAIGGTTGYSDWSDPVSHMAM